MAAKKSKFDTVAEYIKSLVNKDGRYTEFGSYLSEIKKNPEKNPYGSMELLAELAERILLLKKSGKIKEALLDAEEIYSTVIPFGEETENYELLRSIFLKIFDKDGIYTYNLFSKSLYACFSDKLL